MQKFVKFRFTLSALSAMEYIFGILSDLRCRSVIINGVHFWSDCKGLKMKTYTLTWRPGCSWNKSGLCRCRWSPLASLWPKFAVTPLEAFLFFSHCFVNLHPRLTCCGKLVARSATYQGV